MKTIAGLDFKLYKRWKCRHKFDTICFHIMCILLKISLFIQGNHWSAAHISLHMTSAALLTETTFDFHVMQVRNSIRFSKAMSCDNTNQQTHTHTHTFLMLDFRHMSVQICFRTVSNNYQIVIVNIVVKRI